MQETRREPARWMRPSSLCRLLCGPGTCFSSESSYPFGESA
jgi:hypothetical protein